MSTIERAAERLAKAGLGAPKRMRISVAQGGESLSQLGRRVGNRWDPNETAVANGLHVAEPLEAGQLVKIARREPVEQSAPAVSDLPLPGGATE